MERRKFLKYTAATAATPFLFRGQWMSAFAGNSILDMVTVLNPDRKLVLVQLNGGNDGLNMLIPISQYDNLANARGNILVAQSQILKLTNETGLHPSMPELTAMYKDGKVQFIQGVGYPNPNLSHFRSKDILMSASDSNTNTNSGWMGRLFSDNYPNYPIGYPNTHTPHPVALTLGSTSSAICQGDLANYSSVLTNLNSVYSYSASDNSFPDTPAGNELRFISNIMEQTDGYLKVIRAAAAKAKNLSTLYPTSGQNTLADQLKIVASLIGGGLKTQLYVVNLGGWDTHSGQATEADKTKGIQPDLLSKLSKAIDAFQDDLKLMNKADEVMGFVFSEFGRRIKSNDSFGTDHGTTWPAILFGSKVNPTIIGSNPSIAAVVGKSDNLPLQTDFRSIYASIFKQWYQIDDQEITQVLSRSFPMIPVVSQSTGISAPLAERISNIKLWPNPVENHVKLSFDSDGGHTQIRIFAMNGQLVKNLYQGKFTSGTQQVQLQLGHLQTGVYLLEIQQGNSKETVRLMMK